MTIADVLAANQSFYDAHEQRDLDAMRLARARMEARGAPRFSRDGAAMTPA